MATDSKPAKAAAAKAEAEKKERTVEWEGLTLTLPPDMPEAVFMDLALVQGGDDPTATFDMLSTMVGVDQFKLVRNKLRNEDKVTLKEVAELVGRVFESYGVDEGESEASQDS